MIQLSVKQQHILDLVAFYNLMISAVAGAGKTTTFLEIAKAYPRKSYLLLTYNARLKLETRQKVLTQNIRNLEVHSYHSFCVTYISPKGFTDMGMDNALNKKHSISSKVPNFDVLMIDECQDMTALYFRLVRKIKSELKQIGQVILVGDPRQNIFGFKGADERYLTLGPSLFFSFSSLDWKTPMLDQSFRITKPMADFMNDCIFHKNYIVATKPGEKPTYLVCDVYKNTLHILLRYLYPYLKDDDKIKSIRETYFYNSSEPVNEFEHHKYNYEDIFIIAPSVRTETSPIRKLANKLTDLDIPIYVPVSDDESLDLDVIRGKIVFSTFHQVKGLERKYVIVLGFDQSYFKFYARNENPYEIPNPMYVAITRASEKLLLIHNANQGYLPFLKLNLLSKFTNFKQVGSIFPSLFFFENEQNSKNHTVVDLVRHISDFNLAKALSFIEIQQSKKRGKGIYLTSKTNQDELVESVCEINGTAIPLFYSYSQDQPVKWNKMINSTSYEEFKRSFLEKVKTKSLQIDDMLKFATLYHAETNGFHFKTKQILDYNWIPEEVHGALQERMFQNLDKNAIDEVLISDGILSGKIDRIDTSNVWELKCVGQLSGEHFLQLGVYMYLYEKKRTQIVMKLDTWKVNKIIKEIKEFDPLLFEYFDKKIQTQRKRNNKHLLQEEIRVSLQKVKRFRLWNILDDEEYEITASLEKLTEMVYFLIETKYGKKLKISDEEFLRQA